MHVGHTPILIIINQNGAEYLFVEQHRIDDMRKIKRLVILELFIVAAELLSILKAIATGTEEMAHYPLLDDIGHIEHIIYCNITLVLRVNDRQVLKGIDCNTVLRQDLISGEEAIGILDEHHSCDAVHLDGTCHGLDLAIGGFIKNCDMCVGEFLTPELHGQLILEHETLIMVTQYHKIDIIYFIFRIIINASE